MFNPTSYTYREGNLPVEANNNRNSVLVPPTATVSMGPDVTDGRFPMSKTTRR